MDYISQESTLPGIGNVNDSTLALEAVITGADTPPVPSSPLTVVSSQPSRPFPWWLVILVVGGLVLLSSENT